MNLYTDIDATCCAYLERLVDLGRIPKGDVLRADIRQIRPADLAGYVQVHFFCGIGGWPYALGLAGWPANWPAWTASLPCQPFSSAGKRMAERDERHLWPAFRRLVAECRPPVVFGEQVASKAGRRWLAGVRLDLESVGYAVGAADLPAACVAAPHRRQRLWWVADADGARRKGPIQESHQNGKRLVECGIFRRLADAERNGGRLDESERRPQGRTADGGPREGLCETGGLGDAGRAGSPIPEREAVPGAGRGPEGRATVEPGCTFWSDFDVVACRDGKARRVEPGTFPLAHGVPGRVAALRGYGNAIVPQVAAEFVRAYMETRL